MSVLFCLSDDIIKIILQDWICLKSLAKLDSAVCSHNDRSSFLRLLQSETFIRDENDIPKQVKSYLDWLANRKMKFKTLSLGYGPSRMQAERFAEVLGGPHVKSIHLSELNGESTNRVLQAMTLSGCSQLDNVTLYECSWSSLSSLPAQDSLRELTLDWMCMEPDDNIFIGQLPKLQRLSVWSHIGPFDTTGLIRLLKASPNVTDLNMSLLDMADEALYALANHAGKLQRLSLSECEEVGSEAITALAGKCTNLKALHVTDCAIDDAGVEAFARSSPHLETVELQGDITDAAVVALVTRCGATLRNLSLSGCTFGSDGSLLAIAEHCVDLRALELRDCKGLTPANLARMVQSLPEDLRELVLYKCTGVTDAVLTAIAVHLPLLKLLNVISPEGGSQYSEDTVTVVARFLCHLQSFAADERGSWQHSAYSVRRLGSATPLVMCSFSISTTAFTSPHNTLRIPVVPTSLSI